MSRSLLVIALLVSLPAYGASQYWVAVGSYSSMPQAEKGRALLAQRVVESLSIITADADGVLRYRVMAGPYDTSIAAAQARDSASGSGVVGAWIAQLDVDLVPESSGTGEGIDAYTDTDWSTDYADDFPELELDNTQSETNQLAPREKIERKLVDQAPAGYQLHRLNRE